MGSGEKMSDGQEKGVSSALEALYDDPLRPATAKAGRTVVIVSLIAISVALFGARLAPSSVVPLSFEDRPDVLPALLFAVLLLLTLNFGLKAWTDWLRDKEVRLVITRYIEQQRAKTAVETAHDINRAIATQEPGAEWDNTPLESWEEEADAVVRSSKERVAAVEEALGLRTVPRVLRLVRIGAEILIPLGLGIVGLLLSAQQALESTK